jgi:hypothetical protein
MKFDGSGERKRKVSRAELNLSARLRAVNSIRRNRGMTKIEKAKTQLETIAWLRAQIFRLPPCSDEAVACAQALLELKRELLGYKTQKREAVLA